MAALLNKLERWAFAPDARHQPGIWRILLSGWALWRGFDDWLPRLSDFASRPAELVDPVSIARWLSLPMQPGASAILALKIAFGVLGLLALLGIFTRVTTIAFALLTFYLGLVANAWGYSAHATGLPALALLVVAFSPGIDALSLERRALGDSSSVWPLRLILVLLALTYFTAGVSKLRHGGADWTDGQTLAFYLGGGSLRDRVSATRFIADRNAPETARFRDGVGLADWAWVAEPTALGRAIALRPTLTRLLSIFSLLLELLFPLALLGRRPLAVLLGLAALFHLGIEATLRISFLPYLIVYALFIDWYGLAHGIRARIERRR
jgi:hypothetical protein